jgi:hypothetical protein
MGKAEQGRAGRWSLRRQLRAAGLSLMALSLAGCTPFENEFFWIRADGDHFVLEYKLDLTARKIIFFERRTPGPHSSSEVRPRPGEKHILRVIDDVDDCSFVDERNWTCEDRGFGDENISMSNGELFHNYSMESRKYRFGNVLNDRTRACLDFDVASCRIVLRALWTRGMERHAGS